jgi:hypothetical protein
MTYAAIMASMGMLMAYAGFDTNSKVLYVIGMVLFSFGLFSGHIIEDRMNKRIENLEDELKET